MPAEQIIPPEEQFVSMRTVCETFEVTSQTVRSWIKKGYLRAIQIDGKWRINRQSMRDFANSRYGNG